MKRALLGVGVGTVVLVACVWAIEQDVNRKPKAVSKAAVAAARPELEVTILAATHHPKVNVDWPVMIVATEHGKPVAGTLTMAVLFGGVRVGQIDNGKVYHFDGSWHERPGNAITWPATAKGYLLSFEVIVKADGATVNKTWGIDVVG